MSSSGQMSWNGESAAKVTVIVLGLMLLLSAWVSPLTKAEIVVYVGGLVLAFGLGLWRKRSIGRLDTENEDEP